MEDQPLYKRIYNALLEKISSGEYAPGARLPAEKELCETFGVSRITSKRALELLADQGLVIRRPGKGTFVNANFQSRGYISSVPAIGLVIPDFSDSFGTKLIYGIEESCTALGYQLVIKRTRDRAKEEEEALNSLAGAAGILLLPIHGDIYNSEILKLVLEKRALVFVDRRMRGLAAPVVTTNNLEAAMDGASYLLQLGHRNMAFFSGPVRHTSTVEDRYQGFIQAFAKFGISHNPAYLCEELSSIWTWPFYSPKGIQADVDIAAKFLKARPEISAAFAAEYSMALIVKAAAETLGRQVPKDFSIITFDAPPAITGIPPITHLAQDEYAIGKTAVETIHRIITRTDTASDGVVIPAKLVVGSSTGPREARKSRQQDSQN